MSRLRIRLLPAAATALALAAATSAAALPPRPDRAAAPGRATAAVAAEVPLAAAEPPANDEAAAAAPVAGLPFTASVDTLEATTAADDPSCFGNAASVWYAYTAPVATTVVADTFGSDYDTTLAAYTGAQGALTEVACNDDAGGGAQSRIAVPVHAGVTYLFMAAGTAGGGSLVLTLDASAFPQRAVRATRALEATPSGDPDHVAWAQAPRRGGAWTLYVRADGARPHRVNRPRTSGFSGGFEGRRLVYQEARGNRSDIRFYHLARRTRSAPSGVNTRHWEWHPTLSGDLLLFGRRHLGARADLVLLRDLDAGRTLVLDRLRWGRRTLAEPGQVAGDYATWFRCTPACDVFLRHIPSGTTTRIPNPDRRQQYSPAVTSDGTVYFLRSGRGCGTSVRIVRRPLAGPSRVLARLARGLDSAHTYAIEEDDGTTTLLFDRVRCSTGARDIFQLIDP